MLVDTLLPYSTESIGVRFDTLLRIRARAVSISNVLFIDTLLLLMDTL